MSSNQQNSFGPTTSYYTGFSLKATLLYIGLSLGALMVVIILLTLAIVVCTQPGRRRRGDIQALERQRAAAIQAVRAEEGDFKPQVRSFPVIIVQPDDTEIAYGKKISFEESPQPHQGTAIPPPDSELGESSTQASTSGSSVREEENGGSVSSSESNISEAGDELSFNPLTHYLTERHARVFYFEAVKEG